MYGQIVSAVLTAVLIWVVSDWRPTFKFDRKIARDLFGYGKHIMGASIIIFLVINIDDAIVGRVLGIEALGFYTLAYTISNLPATQITHLVSRVMFPLYSKLQDDRNALKDAYLKTLKYVSMLSIPVAFGIFVIAPDFVSVVLGEKWMLAVPALQVLCILGLIRSITSPLGEILKAIGKPNILIKTSLASLILIIISLYPLTNSFGIVGTALSISGTSLIVSIYIIHIISKMININPNEILSIIAKPLLSSFVMISLVYTTNTFVSTPSIMSVLISITEGILCYCILMGIIAKNDVSEIRKQVFG